MTWCDFPMAEIRLDSVDFRYPGAAADTLHGLDLHVADGEAHALLGASGAGKTTLLNLLSGLLTPTGGRVLFNGEDVSHKAGRERHLSQVFQFPVLYESLTVAQNLAFPLKTRGAVALDVTERTRHVARELEIEALLDRKPGRLSLFEKQLVAVGKALVRPDVSVVLLDEPLTAVEPHVKWQLRQTLRRAQHDLGVTMIYVTHDQTEALTFADRVTVLTESGILQSGTPEEIYQTPAHPFVGHFVGSPGMNFVPAQVADLGTDRTLGFRPEWLALCMGSSPRAHLNGVVARHRGQGTRGGNLYGLLTIATEHGDVHYRGATDAPVGARVSLRVRRYVLFAGESRVASGELA